MRCMWLEKNRTGLIWDCLPPNPYSITGGCMFANPSGLGYQQEISQSQIDVDYFINSIKSLNQSVIVEAYFNGDEHLQNFTIFIGDFTEPMRLYYSPDGKIQPYDQISKPYYKPVVLSKFEKGEKNTAGWYVCKLEFTSQSDVWRKDYKYSFNANGTTISTAPLVYPYEYPYEFRGRNTAVINVDNGGRETGCIVKLRNKGASSIVSPEWFSEHVIIDKYGNKETEVQKSKFNIILAQNYELYVDSNATTQQSKVIRSDNSEESVSHLQEPSWEYINFIKLMHGTNRFVFYVDTNNIDVSIEYAELKEVV